VLPRQSRPDDFFSSQKSTWTLTVRHAVAISRTKNKTNSDNPPLYCVTQWIFLSLISSLGRMGGHLWSDDRRRFPMTKWRKLRICLTSDGQR
jgi:hypothetical protein